MVVVPKWTGAREVAAQLAAELFRTRDRAGEASWHRAFEVLVTIASRDELEAAWERLAADLAPPDRAPLWIASAHRGARVPCLDRELRAMLEHLRQARERGRWESGVATAWAMLVDRCGDSVLDAAFDAIPLERSFLGGLWASATSGRADVSPRVIAGIEDRWARAPGESVHDVAITLDVWRGSRRVSAETVRLVLSRGDDRIRASGAELDRIYADDSEALRSLAEALRLDAQASEHVLGRVAFASRLVESIARCDRAFARLRALDRRLDEAQRIGEAFPGILLARVKGGFAVALGVSKSPPEAIRAFLPGTEAGGADVPGARVALRVHRLAPPREDRPPGRRVVATRSLADDARSRAEATDALCEAWTASLSSGSEIADAGRALRLMEEWDEGPALLESLLARAALDPETRARLRDAWARARPAEGAAWVIAEPESEHRDRAARVLVATDALPASRAFVAWVVERPAIANATSVRLATRVLGQDAWERAARALCESERPHLRIEALTRLALAGDPSASDALAAEVFGSDRRAACLALYQMAATSPGRWASTFESVLSEASGSDRGRARLRALALHGLSRSGDPRANDRVLDSVLRDADAPLAALARIAGVAPLELDPATDVFPGDDDAR